MIELLAATIVLWALLITLDASKSQRKIKQLEQRLNERDYFDEIVGEYEIPTDRHK